MIFLFQGNKLKLGKIVQFLHFIGNYYFYITLNSDKAWVVSKGHNPQ
jgi:hypothetical protein